MSFHGVPASLDAGFRIRTTPPDRCPTRIATPPSGICAAALLPGHSSVAGTVLRPRYRGRLQHRLQVGPHHFLDPVDCREPGDQLQIRLFRSLAICSERLDGHIDADFVSVFEAVCDGFLRRVDPNGDAINRDGLDASAEGRLQSTRTRGAGWHRASESGRAREAPHPRCAEPRW